MRLRLARNRLWIYLAAALVVAALVFLRTPYSLILPGRAVDLRQVVTVPGHAPPASHFFLTDVRFAQSVPLAELIAAFSPGVRIVRTQAVVPGDVTPEQFEGAMRNAMDESQAIAAAVAERAAHLPVPPVHTRVMAAYFAPVSRAQHALAIGDLLVRVGTTPIRSRADVQRSLRPLRAGSLVTVEVIRGGRVTRVRVPTIAYRGQTAFGVALVSIAERPHLPVPVTYNLPDVAGSSGGLMFALQIYRSLVPGRDPAIRIAGTGTIAYDGTVGPIEGTRQKVIAARDAGARVFLVPRENYAEVAQTPGIRVIPVGTFAQALRAIKDASRSLASSRSRV